MAGRKIANKSWHRRRAKLAEQATKVQGSSATTRVQGSKTMRSSTSATTRVQGSKASNGDPQATTKLDPKRCAIYARTSTTRVQGSSSPCQGSQIAKALVEMTINDCTSGTLPDHRQQFHTMFVTIASKHGVQLIPGDSLVDSPDEVPEGQDEPVDSPDPHAMMATVMMKFQRDKMAAVMKFRRDKTRSTGSRSSESKSSV